MSSEAAPAVGVIIPAYNGREDLARCLESLATSTYPNLTVVVVDNASTDDTVALVRDGWPNVVLLTESRNTGYAGAMARGWAELRRRGVAYVVALNQDVVVTPGWLEPLLRELQANPDVVATQPLILRADDHTIINSVGNHINYLGFGYAVGEGVSIADSRLQRYLKGPVEVTYASGAAMLIRAADITRLGFFQPHFFMYHEDLDFGWRIRLAGGRSTLVPSSVVYHRYEFSRSAMIKYEFGERNRLLVLLENYHVLTLLLIFPAWLVMEVGVLTLSMVNGWSSAKLRGYGYVIAHLPEILAVRRRHQALRRSPESVVVRTFVGDILYQGNGPSLLPIANPFLRLYWAIVRRLIVW